MKFDEKPKRRSLHLKKSRAELSRGSVSSTPKKPEPDFSASASLDKPYKKSSVPKQKKKVVKVSRSPRRDQEDFMDDEALFSFRSKAEKFPEGYEEDETFFESISAAISRHKFIASIIVVAVIIGVGTFTGAFKRLFSDPEVTPVASAADEEAFLVKPKTVFTQGKFNLNVENTDAGVDIICETNTDEEGNETKTCRAKTEEDRKKEEEEKEREEQEKKAKEEREKEEQEDKEARENKKTQTTTTAEKKEATSEEPVAVIGLTSISGCPAEALAGSTVILKSMVLPYNAENQNVIWSSTSAAKVVYEGTGNTATVTVGEGDTVIITAMSVDGGYSEHCRFPIVDHLTE